MKAKSKPSEAQAWEFFRKQYPAVAAYLKPFAERARRRDDQGQFWWELRPCVYYDAFEQSKIVYPDIAKRAEIAWAERVAYLGNTAYCIPTTKKHLCAILNSCLIEYIYARLSPQIRGGFYRFIAQYMERLPIVEPAPADQARLAALVDQLQALGGQGAEAERLEREVDAIVYRTYGLSNEEIAEIERWHAERRAQLSGGRRGQTQAALPEDMSEKEEEHE